MNEERRVPAEVYSRVVGYFRPVHQWNKGKQSEFADRRPTPVAELIDSVSRRVPELVVAEVSAQYNA